MLFIEGRKIVGCCDLDTSRRTYTMIAQELQ